MASLMPADPAHAAYAWLRLRRIMRWLMAAMVALVIAAMRLAVRHAGSASVRRYVIAALVVGAVMLVGSAVMGFSYLRRLGAGENPPPEPRRSDAPE